MADGRCERCQSKHQMKDCRPQRSKIRAPRLSYMVTLKRQERASSGSNILTMFSPKQHNPTLLNLRNLSNLINLLDLLSHAKLLSLLYLLGLLNLLSHLDLPNYLT